MCSGVLCSPLAPGSPAAWHTHSLQLSPPALQSSLALGAEQRSRVLVFPGKMALPHMVGCSHSQKWCMSQKQQKSVLILG